MKALGKLVPVYYILGNHDLGLENFDFESIANVKCLEGVVTEIDGLTVYGVVDTPCFDMPVLATRWHKMNPSYDYDEALWREVPKVDVIVSHGPPFQCLDWCGRAVGSPGLRDYIQRVQPKLVLTGHIHEQGGGRDSIRETIVINCARDTVVEVINNA
jgi:Icc-related predicted phosphoesterase